MACVLVLQSCSSWQVQQRYTEFQLGIHTALMISLGVNASVQSSSIKELYTCAGWHKHRAEAHDRRSVTAAELYGSWLTVTPPLPKAAGIATQPVLGDHPPDFTGQHMTTHILETQSSDAYVSGTLHSSSQMARSASAPWPCPQMYLRMAGRMLRLSRAWMALSMGCTMKGMAAGRWKQN